MTQRHETDKPSGGAEPALVALDWGTTSFRAFLLDAKGGVLDRRDEPMGILKVPGGDFDAVFTAVTERWYAAHGALPALASGMIGSRQGWVEAPYCPCPAGAEDLGRRLAPVRTQAGHSLRIVPGVSRDSPGEAPDVMRGEETQIAGAVAAGQRDGLFVMPGTHSKWVEVRDGRIQWFATFMTGEVFAVLCQHSILGRLMADEDAGGGRGAGEGRGGTQEDAFARGLAAAGGPLLHALFSARTLGLFERLPPEGLRSYLSGMLIGAEILQARETLARRGTEARRVTIVGGAALAARYADALAHAGIEAATAPETVTTDGLLLIARAAGLIGR
ncbi:2-dehydro-3-deoxygalactonokinase [Arenibaculum pallidiluteum]|uniref:2-dehydro-3-deoxygalactonokinase n=1 Tax=Arenibaculum pallidiluteum TaxID=2812559 RepID=UPI001A95D319|nr:2-dehydro-3-deoxygalactonokinase [Arenibaculum pallidiluteum]